MIAEIIILLIIGWGVGVITGLIGGSGVAVVAPILVVLLKYDAYTAIGIGLAIDVVASLVAAQTYYKHKNIHIKAALLLASVTIIGALAGSYLSSHVPTTRLGWLTGFVVFAAGISFIQKPIHDRVKIFRKKLRINFEVLWQKRLAIIISGLSIGLIAGFFGAGGGFMILIALMFVMNYPIHKAVGTSVLLMAFTAFAGAVGHEIYGTLPWMAIGLGCIGAIIGAKSAATFANMFCDERRMGKIAGIVFVILGALMIINQMFFANGGIFG